MNSRTLVCSRIIIPLKVSWVFIVVAMFLSVNGYSVDVQFLNEDTAKINSGHIRLDWVSDHEGEFELQQATQHDFNDARTIYKGHDKASFISGLTNGNYYFRIKEKGNDWSDHLFVMVEYQSLTLAFSLFTIGAIVFILTAAVIIKGSYKYKNAS